MKNAKTTRRRLALAAMLSAAALAAPAAWSIRLSAGNPIQLIVAIDLSKSNPLTWAAQANYAGNIADRVESAIYDPAPTGFKLPVGSRVQLMTLGDAGANLATPPVLVRQGNKRELGLAPASHIKEMIGRVIVNLPQGMERHAPVTLDELPGRTTRGGLPGRADRSEIYQYFQNALSGVACDMPTFIIVLTDGFQSGTGVNNTADYKAALVSKARANTARCPNTSIAFLGVGNTCDPASADCAATLNSSNDSQNIESAWVEWATRSGFSRAVAFFAPPPSLPAALNMPQAAGL